MNPEKATRQSGSLVLNTDGTIITSTGDLQNDEVTATNIYKLLSTLGSSHLGDVTTKFSINYTDHSYIVCLANKKINIVKKSASDIFV